MTTKLEKEYRRVKADLDPIKKRAQEAPEIRKAAKSFGRSLVGKMLELEPQARGWLKRSRALEQEIRVARREHGDEETLQELVHELDDVREKVDRIEARAREDEAVLREWHKLRQQVLDKMKQLDPRVPELLAQRRQIIDGMKKGGKDTR